MNDPAFELLQPHLAPVDGDKLWLVDENIAPAMIACVALQTGLNAISNRYELAQALQSRGIVAVFEDFALDRRPPQSCDRILFRISKEKALVHWVINQSARLLKPGGQLLLAGLKNEGIKTYIKNAESVLGGKARSERGRLTAQVACIEAGTVSSQLLDDKHYSAARVINPGDAPEFISKPGVFGWDRIDEGSAFLIEQLPELIDRSTSRPRSVLDLGCGFGYLTVMAAQLLKARGIEAHFTATDNNAAALHCCAENLRLYGINGDVIAADAGDGIAKRFELVLCNPPFHRGFDVETDLTQHFLRSCREHLARGGVGLFVVNSFIGIEKKAAPLFSAVETLANNGRFKLVLVR